MSELSFCLAAVADIDAIVALVNSAYRGDYSRQGWTTEADLLDGQRADAAMIAALIDPPRSQLLLMWDGATLLGSVHLGLNERSGYLGMFTVEPTRQAHGLGRRFLEAAEDWLRHAGARELEITVLTERTELIGWYERRGFQPTGERRAFPSADPRYGVPKQPLVLGVWRKLL
jgi:GNAT superfamily N-acetyltransferase